MVLGVVGFRSEEWMVSEVDGLTQSVGKHFSFNDNCSSRSYSFDRTSSGT